MRKIKYQSQPTERSCGQTCAAMLLGRPVWRVEHIFGNLDNETRADILCQRLTRHGVTMSERIFNTGSKRIKSGIKGAALLRLWSPGMLGHGVILNGRTVFDPMYGIYPLSELNERTKSAVNPMGFRIESYWRVIE